ncbi:MAG: gliding motility-associated C-terminal domain-containing protein [Flavobacteriales bacterium]|nr:gliding motility-associated C-terminal domain-containing protein [Flavobacteriales bacterium]
MKKVLSTLIIAMAGIGAAHAQMVELTVEQYQQMKLTGTLPAEYHVSYTTLPPPEVQAVNQAKGGGGTGGSCNCWIEPDATYTLALQPNDDGSSSMITLPFQFNLYGELYSTCYVNNNGNVSFVTPFGTYSSAAFPNTQFKMVAPFWADVDTRNNGGTVKYKLTSNALYVNWTDVGYYSQQTDKLNSFQLIISDGTNTDVGVGSTVSFCYKDMQWTTGSASGGVGGFGGTPATVGANRGNGIDYIQFGRFDHAGVDYDGPFGINDGISWLDQKNFVFTTAVSTQNIPPIASSTSLCDTVDVCVNELVDLDVNFLSPEPGQLTTAGYTITPPLNATVTETNSGPANTANLHLQFIPTVADTVNGGIHVITYTATDDGAQPLTASVTVVIRVFYVAAPPPTISGDSVACAMQGVVLTASGGYENYEWSNGWNGETVLVGPGTYYVEASTGACILVSNYITVTEAPNPTPVITGVLYNCGGEPAVLTTDSAYATYAWSNGSTDPSISVGTGTYTVAVTDENGCPGTSPAVNVLSANAPTAMFLGNPNGEIFPGTTVVYTDQSNGNGSPIVDWQWTVDTLASGSGTTFTVPFDTPGIYPVTLTVTTADGCTHTYVYEQIVVPTEIVVPNVFSPNNDGHNDALVFAGVQFYPNTSLKVINRWGKEVYTSTNYKNTWRPGSDVPDGTYYYILKMASGKEYTGNVTLLR